ncbi:MAG: hypothetical protein SH850_16060 [Planctomycetaceae bacterium]|nr:hypothetical protein [Planctomycetaceae bacterium]
MLRRKAEEIKTAIAGVEGLAPRVVEAQQLIPQLRIDLNREQLAAYGLTAEFFGIVLNGRVVTVERHCLLSDRFDEASSKHGGQQ